jgi:UDP-N-acetylglucosamine--N-acetylmuramyl-(pentapeptide) pyrophosphoryl-undecaprenol N-acetylglucosamine transferase
MSEMYENVDFVLSRSGAMTITELIKFEKPSILIPFKYSSENHQYYNAKFLQDFLCSKLIEEDDFSENVFLSTLENLSQNDRILDSMKSNFKKIDIPDTLSMISSFILEEKYAL